MTLYALGAKRPQTPDSTDWWVAPDANVIGDVFLAPGSSIWFGTTIRGDNDPIVVGNGTNIQENCVLHSDPGYPLRIGAGCTIGHKAMLHGCLIGSNVLIGMGATVLNGAKIGANSLVGAGALITEGKEIPEGSLVMGVPGKVVRQLTDDEIEGLRRSARHYQDNAKRFRKQLEALPQ